MKKSLCILLISILSICNSVGQDSFVQLNDEITSVLSKKAADLASNTLIKNDMYGCEIRPFITKRTILGNSFVYKVVKNGIEKEGDRVSITLSDDGKVILQKNKLLPIKENFQQKFTKEQVWDRLSKKYKLENSNIDEYQLLIGILKSKEHAQLYHRFVISDYETMRYLEIKVVDSNLENVLVEHYGTGKLYEHENFGITTNVKRSKVSSRQMTCCSAGSNSCNDGAKIHLIDPTTSSGCNDTSIDFIGSSGCASFRISQAQGISFADNASPGINSEDCFCYTFNDLTSTNLSCTNERNDVNYDKLHSYLYLKPLLGVEGGPNDVTINVDVVDDLIVQGVSSINEIRLGRSDNWNHFGADRFHITHAYFQLVLKAQSSNFLNNSYVFVGSSDYYAHNHYGTLGQCGAHGGIGAPNYVKRDANKSSYTSAVSGGQPGHFIQAWASLLTKLDIGLGGVAGIGSSKVKSLLIASSIAEFDDQYNIITSAQNLYEVASMSSNIDASELCRIKAIMEIYFNNVSSFSLPDPADYYIRDSDNDDGDEPYWFNPMWTSPSIWNSYTAGGAAEDPEVGQVNFINVLVEDLNGIYDPTKELHVYHSMASMGLSWPTDWQEMFVNGERVQGELLSSPMSIPEEVVINGQKVLSFPWQPPNPANLNISDKHHVCIYARITDAHDIPRHSNCETEGSGVGNNTNRFNNIAWKNMTIVDMLPMMPPNPPTKFGTTCYVHNPIPLGDPTLPDVPPNADIFDIDIQIHPEPIRPRFFNDGPADPAFFEKGVLLIDLLSPLDEIWGKSGKGEGYKILEDKSIQVTSDKFSLSNIVLPRGDHYLLRTRFIAIDESNPISFSLRLKDKNGNVVGGETYQAFPNLNRSSFNEDQRNIVLLKPNPSDGIFIIENSGPKLVKEINVFDVGGKLVKTQIVNKDNNLISINLTNFGTGLYTFKVVYENGESITKQGVLTR